MSNILSMDKGTLYWITGLAGSGKTTIGSHLYYCLRERKDSKIVILDGDILKGIVGNDTGYSYDDRLSRARRYSNLCKFLVDQGIDVIICTIAMFDSVRDWNRKYIEKYVEIFLDVPDSVLLERNKKGLYSGIQTEVAGRDVKAELPQNPDIVIKNDGTKTINECVEQILQYKPSAYDTYSRDRDYWNGYYNKNVQTQLVKPSLFAEYISPKLSNSETIMDLGCGNGRDSLFFMEKGLYVIGIDAADRAIAQLRQDTLGKPCEFICDDFVSSKVLYQRQVEHCYSRFTLHAINDDQEDVLFENVYSALKGGGRFYIEARSINDDICGLGEKIARNTYIYNNHFRRFIDKAQLERKLKLHGFNVEYSVEGKGFSPLGKDDPVLVRVICQKP